MTNFIYNICVKAMKKLKKPHIFLAMLDDKNKAKILFNSDIPSFVRMYVSLTEALIKIMTKYRPEIDVVHMFSVISAYAVEKVIGKSGEGEINKEDVENPKENDNDPEEKVNNPEEEGKYLEEEGKAPEEEEGCNTGADGTDAEADAATIKATPKVIKKLFLMVSLSVVTIGAIFVIANPLVTNIKHQKYLESDYALSLTFEKQYHTLAPLGNEIEWIKLNEDERMELLEIVADMDAIRLGLPYRIKLEAQNTDEELGGVYDNNDKMITLFDISEKSAEETLYVLFHELFHSAQHCYVDTYQTYIPKNLTNLYFFHDARCYEDNFMEYVSSSESLFEYMFQEAELDANEYAEKTVSYYTTEIFRYNNGYVKKGEK